MDINAVVLAVSFLSFLALLVIWLTAPLRVDAPVSAASANVVEAAPTAAVAA